MVKADDRFVENVTRNRLLKYLKPIKDSEKIKAVDRKLKEFWLNGGEIIKKGDHTMHLAHGYSHMVHVGFKMWDIVEASKRSLKKESKFDKCGENNPIKNLAEIDPEVAYIAGLMHEPVRPVEDGGVEKHGAKCAKLAEKLLRSISIDLEENEINEIIEAIRNHQSEVPLNYKDFLSLIFNNKKEYNDIISFKNENFKEIEKKFKEKTNRRLKRALSKPLSQLLFIADKCDMNIERVMGYVYDANLQKCLQCERENLGCNKRKYLHCDKFRYASKDGYRMMEVIIADFSYKYFQDINYLSYLRKIPYSVDAVNAYLNTVMSLQTEDYREERGEDSPPTILTFWAIKEAISNFYCLVTSQEFCYQKKPEEIYKDVWDILGGKNRQGYNNLLVLTMDESPFIDLENYRLYTKKNKH